MLGRDGFEPWRVALEDEVCGLDELAHDGDDGDLLGLSALDEALGEGSEAVIAAPCGHGGEVEHAAWPAAPAGDEAQTFPLAAVAVVGSHADQGGGLAPAQGAEFGHPHHQGGGDHRPHARQREQQTQARQEVGVGLDHAQDLADELCLQAAEAGDLGGFRHGIL